MTQARKLVCLLAPRQKLNSKYMILVGGFHIILSSKESR